METSTTSIGGSIIYSVGDRKFTLIEKRVTETRTKTVERQHPRACGSLCYCYKPIKETVTETINVVVYEVHEVLPNMEAILSKEKAQRTTIGDQHFLTRKWPKTYKRRHNARKRVEALIKAEVDYQKGSAQLRDAVAEIKRLENQDTEHVLERIQVNQRNP